MARGHELPAPAAPGPVGGVSGADFPALLARTGPLPLARAMQLGNARYYATRDPLGHDFTTAPEISQMFGELLGAWLADLWHRAGRPPVRLVELGPGRGTLMADLLRVARKAGLEAPVHLVETSPPLKALQAQRLPGVHHHDDLAEVPDDRAILLVANEFLDALGVDQFERTAAGWALRVVTLEKGRPARRLGPVAAAPPVPPALRDAPLGGVFEWSAPAQAVVAAVARRLADRGGAALFVDYGFVGPALGDTLQAMPPGRFSDPVAALGEGDVSAHVDFGAMAAAARQAAPVTVHGPVGQGPFLWALGLAQRAERLKAHASLTQRAAITAAVARLTGTIGGLFQVLGLTAPHWPAPAGFG